MIPESLVKNKQTIDLKLGKVLPYNYMVIIWFEDGLHGIHIE